MSIPVKVTVTVTLERSDPSGRVDVYGNINSFVVSGPSIDCSPEDKTAIVARTIFMQCAQQMRDSMAKARRN